MPSVTSADGTRIAFEQNGTGEPVILVLGAFNERGTGAPLAARLAENFATVIYDRRGRGESTDGKTYTPDREVEDIAALVRQVGGPAALFGYSSGATLALLAAASGVPVMRVALYESPTPAPGRDARFWLDLARSVDTAIANGDRGGAVELFQTRAVGMPEALVAQLRDAPFRPALERIAHTLSYDLQVLASDAELPSRVAVPVLVAVGGDSPPALQDAARSLVYLLPEGSLRTLPGNGHDIDPESLGPVLTEFLRHGEPAP